MISQEQFFFKKSGLPASHFARGMFRSGWKDPEIILIIGNFTDNDNGESPVFCVIAGVVTTIRFLQQLQAASRVGL